MSELSPLSEKCPKCGAELAQTDKMCWQCYAPLGEPAAPEAVNDFRRAPEPLRSRMTSNAIIAAVLAGVIGFGYADALGRVLPVGDPLELAWLPIIPIGTAFWAAIFGAALGARRPWVPRPWWLIAVTVIAIAASLILIRNTAGVVAGAISAILIPLVSATVVNYFDSV